MTPHPREDSDRAVAVAIGAELAYWRRRRGLSRQELADAVGLSANTIGRYERGNTIPDVAETWSIAQALDVTPSLILERAEQALESDRRHTIRDEVERQVRGERTDTTQVEEPEAGDPRTDVG